MRYPASVRPLTKALALLREHGAKGGLAIIAEKAKHQIVDASRTIVLLEVDLTVAKNCVRDRDRADDFRILELEGPTIERTAAAMAEVDLARAESVRTRGAMGTRGWAAEYAGEIIGYVFWAPGTDRSGASAHADLEWLPMRPTADEVYTFDYFVVPASRGKGGVFCRHVQQAQRELGFTRSYGYVYLDNRPALWLYRTVGWKELGRLDEQKLLAAKLTVVDGRLYVVRPFSRAAVGTVPQPILRVLSRIGDGG